MAVFQKLMEAGSVLHRSHSGQYMEHRPVVGPSQPLLCSLVEQRVTEREVEGTVCRVVTGVLLVVRSELAASVTRGSKFVDGETVWNFDDQENYDVSGVYSRIPVYRTLPIRKGPSEGYKREPLGT